MGKSEDLRTKPKVSLGWSKEKSETIFFFCASLGLELRLLSMENSKYSSSVANHTNFNRPTKEPSAPRNEQRQAWGDRHNEGTSPGIRPKPSMVHRLRDADGRIFEIDTSDPKRKPTVIGNGRECEIRLGDPFASREHCKLVSRNGALFLVDSESKNGTYIDGHQVRDAEVRVGSRIRIGGTVFTALGRGSKNLPTPEAELLGKSETFIKALDMAKRAAAASCSVLILGETGTGKELFAQLIHKMSPRKTNPFVALNCGAISADLIGSELFGHKRGAFTGAFGDKEGLLSAGEGGTLFLDEIGELPIDQQPHLLRALETRKIRPVGDTEEKPFDVRLVAATNRMDVGQAGKALRTDLYHRLATVVLYLPPLRERRDDIPLLVNAFLKQLEPEYGRRHLAPDVMVQLCHYNWPGNIRELKQAVERAVALCPENLEADVLLPNLKFSSAVAELTACQNPLYKEIVKDALALAYKKHGSIRRAAASLGIPKSTFADRARRFGVRTRPGIDWEDSTHRGLARKLEQEFQAAAAGPPAAVHAEKLG